MKQNIVPFSRKLFKWIFSEQNVGKNSEKSVRIFTLWSIPTRQYLRITGDNWRYRFDVN